MINETFDGTSLPAGWTQAVSGDGSITFPAGSVVLSSASAGTCVLRSPIEALTADGQSQWVRITSASTFNSLVVLRMGTGSADFCPAFNITTNGFAVGRYRDATGFGAMPSTSSSFVTLAHPHWLRVVRASGTTFTLESAPDDAGAPGTPSVRGTTDAGDSLTIDMANARWEFRVTTGGGNITIDRVGDGSSGGGGGSGLAAVLMRRRLG